MVSPTAGTQNLMNTTLSPMRSERPSLKGPNAFLSTRNNNLTKIKFKKYNINGNNKSL